MFIRLIGMSRLTSSFIAFINHSPPLLSGESLMMPTRASSEQTRTIGRCRTIRADSSFSLCSGLRLANAAREGALIAAARFETSAGVNVLEKRLCKADMICTQDCQYPRIEVLVGNKPQLLPRCPFLSCSGRDPQLSLQRARRYISPG
jgi:hypothetical protein